MAIFTKKITCSQCGGNFKRRRNNKNKYCWICSRRENGYSNCKRVQMDEEFLISAIQKRYLIRRGSTIPVDEISSKVESIVIEDVLLFKIKLTDFEDEIEYGRRNVIF